MAFAICCFKSPSHCDLGHMCVWCMERAIKIHHQPSFFFPLLTPRAHTRSRSLLSKLTLSFFFFRPKKNEEWNLISSTLGRKRTVHSSLAHSPPWSIDPRVRVHSNSFLLATHSILPFRSIETTTTSRECVLRRSNGRWNVTRSWNFFAGVITCNFTDIFLSLTPHHDVAGCC